MTILGYKPNHDGGFACLRDGKLLFSEEMQYDSRPRHSHVKPHDWFRIFSMLPAPPDVVAVGGWHLDPFAKHDPTPDDLVYDYRGTQRKKLSEFQIFGRSTRLFAATHERSHLFCSYGMSPFAQGQRCYALIWEGRVGSFYCIEPDLSCNVIGTPVDCPGLRYSYLYYLADPKQTTFRHPSNAAGPGKLMALAGYGQPGPLDSEQSRLLEYMLSPEVMDHITDPGIVKSNFPFATPFKNIGVEDQSFKNLARAFSDRLFDIYHRFARAHLSEGLPLLIGGGCGLNCEWNTRWKNCGLFPAVFIPPCTDDSGSAIGSAIDAQFHATGNAKIVWNVYAGADFVENEASNGFSVERLDLSKLARILEAGHIVAWAQGKCEIGPRALGNRSLLAAPFNAATAIKLNHIKSREQFRPIAPICLSEDVHLHFDWRGESPHMLFFQNVTDSRLAAVTHVDGTARAQTLTREQNPLMHELLLAFKQRTGVGVLCNTSLNFKGKGFINRSSDLFRYAQAHAIDTVVIGQRLYHRRQAAAA